MRDYLPHMAKAPIFFRSGLSSVADFDAARKAHVPAGVTSDRVSERVEEKLTMALRFGCARLFIDSGAFGSFKRGEVLSPEGFEHHLALCERLAATASNAGQNEDAATFVGSLHFVAPDVVSNQEATLQLLRQFADRLHALAQVGVVIVPLHKGARSLSALFSEVKALIGGGRICAGLPFNAAALSVEETMSFLREARPERIHFLGAALSRRFQDGVLAEVTDAYPETEVSYDAAVVRNICDELRATSVADIARDGDVIKAELDEIETEISPLILRDELSFRLTSELLHATTAEVVAAFAEYDNAPTVDGLADEKRIVWNVLNDEWFWAEYRKRYVRAVKSLPQPVSRAAALASHPKFALDPVRSTQAHLGLAA